MINYNKNKLINECLVTYYETFSLTLDTGDYVPEKYNEKILKYIFKNMKRQFRKLDKEDRRYQRQLKKEARSEALQMNGDEAEEEVNEDKQVEEGVQGGEACPPPAASTTE